MGEDQTFHAGAITRAKSSKGMASLGDEEKFIFECSEAYQSESGEVGWGHIGKSLVWMALLINFGLNPIYKGKSAKTYNRFVTKSDFSLRKTQEDDLGSGEKKCSRRSVRRLLY